MTRSSAKTPATTLSTYLQHPGEQKEGEGGLEHKIEPLHIEGTDSVAWHVSAGTDFTPLLMWASHSFIKRYHRHKKIPTPELHLFTCIFGNHLEDELLELLNSEKKEIYADGDIRITFEDYELVTFGDVIPLSNIKKHCDAKRGDRFSALGADGFYMNVEIHCAESGHSEKTRLLYLLGENIKTFHHFMLNHWCTVRYMAASCEGLAFGCCKRTIFSHFHRMQYYSSHPCMQIEWLIIPRNEGLVLKLLSESRDAGYIDYRNCSFQSLAHYRGHIAQLKIN